MKGKHNVGLLRFVFRAYSPALKSLQDVLDEISESFKWSAIQIEYEFADSKTLLDSETALELSLLSRNSRPGLESYWLLFLGIAELATLCEEVAIEFESASLMKAIDELKKDFQFKDIRDIIAHWEEYSAGAGRLQQTKYSPSQAMIFFPFMNVGGNSKEKFFFELAGKYVNLFDLYSKMEAICSEVRRVLYSK